MYTYEYPRPSVTVDIVVFGYAGNASLQVLLIQRAAPPFRDQWALPGGFVEMDEDLEAGAQRELTEETGLRDLFLEQLYTFGRPDRDPRGRVISIAYYALVNLQDHTPRAASDAVAAAWFPLRELPPLAFDHAEILTVAKARLSTKVRYQPIGFELLPEEFTLAELQTLYETLLNAGPLNKRNFRTRIKDMGILEEVGKQSGVAHRPAILYRFNAEKYRQLAGQNQGLRKSGLSFEI